MSLVDGPTMHITYDSASACVTRLSTHKSAASDERFSGWYLAPCLKYDLFRSASYLASVSHLMQWQLSLYNVRDLSLVRKNEVAVAPPPSNVAKYLQDFGAEPSDAEMNTPHFRRRFLFVTVVTNKKAQADEMIQFVPFDSELGASINETYQQIMLKEVERPKYIPSQVVQLMRHEGYTGFNMYHHTLLWQSMDAKNAGKGYGVMIANTWFWYERWVEEVKKHCSENEDKYKLTIMELAA